MNFDIIGLEETVPEIMSANEAYYYAPIWAVNVHKSPFLMGIFVFR